METDFARWSDSQNLPDRWSYRSELAARFVPAGATLMDIGCGKMAIEQFLPNGCTYIPVDLVRRDDRTIVCDLNAGEYPPADGVTHVSVLGVVEYLKDPAAFFRWLDGVPARRLVLSYIPGDRGMPVERRREAGWINDLSRDDVVRLAATAGFVPVAEEPAKNNLLFVFDRHPPLVRGAATTKALPHALLTYSETGNLGDEIQSLAAQQFLPSTDLWLDRDRLDAAPACKAILNGWHTHAPERWPPSKDLQPLLVSIHLTDEVFWRNKLGRAPADVLLEGENLEFFRAHGPVGARDRWTLQRLRDAGLDAWFSGCMTLTLGPGRPFEKLDYVCAVDLPPAALAALRARTHARIVTTTHADAVTVDAQHRAARARRLLSIYARARCVVTTRLHCALPSLALQTPVLMMPTADDDYRFSGLLDLVRHTTVDAFCRGEDGFDVAAPTPNREDYRAVRDNLACVVNRFVGVAEGTTPPHPFAPLDDVENLIAIEQTLAGLTEASKLGRQFEAAFKPGRDYAKLARPDFLRDVAQLHMAAGRLDEARRLLQMALAERPGGGRI
ncbi:MAG TPA: polysaccharide pyruvyl transferase family protein, partial [Nevskiaceae bacterium]|nr:polysaccharide pyruvyl transferase family protein [Nevskiaceae bacterium]